MTLGDGSVDIGPSRITDDEPEPDDEPDRIYEKEIEKRLERELEG